jgi:hypothetical protein
MLYEEDLTCLLKTVLKRVSLYRTTEEKLLHLFCPRRVVPLLGAQGRGMQGKRTLFIVIFWKFCFVK